MVEKVIQIVCVVILLESGGDKKQEREEYDRKGVRETSFDGCVFPRVENNQGDGEEQGLG